MNKNDFQDILLSYKHTTEQYMHIFISISIHLVLLDHNGLIYN